MAHKYLEPAHFDAVEGTHYGESKSLLRFSTDRKVPCAKLFMFKHEMGGFGLGAADTVRLAKQSDVPFNRSRSWSRGFRKRHASLKLGMVLDSSIATV